MSFYVITYLLYGGGKKAKSLTSSCSLQSNENTATSFPSQFWGSHPLKVPLAICLAVMGGSEGGPASPCTYPVEACMEERKDRGLFMVIRSAAKQKMWSLSRYKPGFLTLKRGERAMRPWALALSVAS